MPQAVADKLKADCGLQFKHKDGKMIMELKPDFKDRTGHSPDHFDSASIGFMEQQGEVAVGILRRDVHKMVMRPRLLDHDYGTGDHHQKDSYLLYFPPVMPEVFHRPGNVSRSIWASKQHGCGALWFHTGEDGRTVTVIDSVESNGRTLDEFAHDVVAKGLVLLPEDEARTEGKGRQIRYIGDWLSSDDDKAFELVFHGIVMDQAKREGTRPSFPVWVEPQAIDGQSGADAIDGMLLGTLAMLPDHDYWGGDKARAERMSGNKSLAMWPDSLVRQLEEYRVVDGAWTTAQKTEGALSKALRLWAVQAR
jgi:hypothetical protein